MNTKLNNSELIYRKLKITDYDEFRKLFYSCFKKRVSLDFFESRYFSDKFSFCYGAFCKTKLVANVGMISLQLNNNKKERIFSRHSSMVLKTYRGKGIFSYLLQRVKRIIYKKVKLVVMWPNKNNLSNFSLDKNKIIKRKYYLYKISLSRPLLTKTKNYQIDDLIKFKKFIQNNNSFFLKNFIYFKKRYLLYQKDEYFINKFEFKNLSSFFILKRNKDSTGINFVILDHFGSEKIQSKHLSCIIADQSKLIFLSKFKINDINFKLLNFLYLKIGFIKNFNKNQKKLVMLNKEIYLGDTDIFITTRNVRKNIC